MNKDKKVINKNGVATTATFSTVPHSPSTIYTAFISLVRVLEHPYEVQELAEDLKSIGTTLKNYFTDFEIILIDNGQHLEIQRSILELDGEIKKNIFLIRLSTPTNFNNAVLAGLDRANGDYTILLEKPFWKHPNLIIDLYQKTQTGFDVVYLRATQNKQAPYRILHRLFYTIMRRYSNLQIDEQAHHSRIISRRALNSLLKMRENLRFMKAIYSIVGYSTAAIEVEENIQNGQQNFGEQFRTSLVAITSFTTFLRSLLLWIFLFSIGFLLLVVYNAIKVRLTNVDIFGTYHEALSGWAFLVVIISVFFAITCLNLYIMSIYLSNIYFEIKQRPLYIIESTERC